jgi:hypothetical protein
MTLVRNCSRRCTLLFALLAACAGSDGELDDLGTLDDGKADTALPRTVELELAAGASKRFRITTAALVARLDQAADVPATLAAKHYELQFVSDESRAPRLAVAGDGTVRNWTLTVTNRGAAALDATLVIDIPRDSGELGIVSDIDKTVLPPEAGAGLPPPYPGIAALLAALERTVAGDVHYVTARTPDGVVEIPDWMAMHGVPPGTIDTGISGVPWVAQAEKVRDISRLLDASIDQPYVLFGDTAHRDPEVYAEILAKYPMRIGPVFIHKVNATVPPTRVQGMHLIDNYAQAAAIAFGDDLLSETEARSIMKTARAEGLAITDSEIEALIDAAR